MWPSVELRRSVGSGIHLLASVLLTVGLFVPWGRVKNSIATEPAPSDHYSPWNFFVANSDGFNVGRLTSYFPVIFGLLLFGPPVVFALAALLRLTVPGLHRRLEVGIASLAIVLGALTLVMAGILLISFSVRYFDQAYLRYASDFGMFYWVAGSVSAVLAVIVFATPSRRN